jgi:anti-sigma regulatory factor (Ser/Thr protein kinase)
MTMTLCLREGRRPFAGCADDLHLMRAWLTKRLTESGMSDPGLTKAAVFMVNELAGNAIKHTASGGTGGTYSVAYRWSHCCLWLAVTDQGGTDKVPAAREFGDLDPLAESGRGLAIIAESASRWGSEPVPGGGRRTWVRIAR